MNHFLSVLISVEGRVLCPNEAGNDVFKTIIVAYWVGELILNLASAFCVGGRRLAIGL